MNNYKWTGKKYDSGLTRKEIAAILRKELAVASKTDADLAGLKVSVRMTGHNSISVTVKALAYNPLNPVWVEWGVNNPNAVYPTLTSLPLYTTAGKNMMEKVKTISNAYNFDDCDTMTDYFHVNYYLDVTLDFDTKQQFKEEITANLEECLKVYRQLIEDSWPLCTECGQKVRYEEKPYAINDKSGLCWDCYHPLAEEARKAQLAKEKAEHIRIKRLTSFTPCKIEQVTGDIFKIRLPKLNKNQTIAEYESQLQDKSQHTICSAKVTEKVILTLADYEVFVQHLLHPYSWLAGKGGIRSTATELLPKVDDWLDYTLEQGEIYKRFAYLAVIEVVAPGKPTIYVDPEGHNYARYVGFPLPPNKPAVRKKRAKIYQLHQKNTPGLGLTQ